MDWPLEKKHMGYFLNDGKWMNKGENIQVLEDIEDEGVDAILFSICLIASKESLLS